MMIDVETICNFFGNKLDDSDMVKYFKKNNFDIQNIKNHEIIGEEKINLYITNIKEGYSLVFVKGKNFLSRERKEYFENYFLVCLHLYSKDYDDTEEFVGNMLYGIKINDLKNDIELKVGKKPDIVNEDINSIQWKEILPNINLSVHFKDDNTPTYISLFL